MGFWYSDGDGSRVSSLGGEWIGLRTEGGPMAGRMFRQAGWVVVVLAIAVSGCSLRNGRVQLVQVRSTPPGAAVFVDGEPAGVTPEEVEVRRRNADPVVRVEKVGFATMERELDRGLSGWFAADLCLAGALAALFVFSSGSDGSSGPASAASGALGAAIVLVPVLATGSAFSFGEEVEVVLAPTEGRSANGGPAASGLERWWPDGGRPEWLTGLRGSADGLGLRKRVRAIWAVEGGPLRVRAEERGR